MIIPFNCFVDIIIILLLLLVFLRYSFELFKWEKIKFSKILCLLFIPLLFFIIFDCRLKRLPQFTTNCSLGTSELDRIFWVWVRDWRSVGQSVLE
jgi:hypothetical protein